MVATHKKKTPKFELREQNLLVHQSVMQYLDTDTVFKHLYKLCFQQGIKGIPLMHS